MISIDHNYDNNPNHTIELETFMNIRDSFKCPDNYDKTQIKQYKLVETYGLVESKRDEIFKSESFLKLKEIFYKGKQTPFSHDFINISVHIRRPNSRDDRIYGTDTPNSYYLDIINTIRNNKYNKPLKIHIYSQGDIRNFSEFISDDTIFHLDESIQDTFLGLVYADILVTSRSSFSYTAGLLTKANTVYFQYWRHHPPLSWWVCKD
jgi:hypothetical protein